MRVVVPVLIVSSGLLLGCGCNRCEFNTTPPADTREALARVNDNLMRLARQPTQYRGTVGVTFRDEGGKRRSFPNSGATLNFRAPQCLRFSVKGLTGTVAEFGSNDERYWIWIEPEIRTLWWGTWAASDGTPSTIPIPPELMLEALLLRPIPTVGVGGRPVLRRDGGRYSLVYWTAGGSSGARMREYVLDPKSGFFPKEIIDRAQDGRILMRAKLSNYRPVGKGGPCTPRRYDVRWPENDARMTFRIRAAEFRPDLPEWICEYPERWSGRVERIDQAAPSIEQ